jgi:hypothetical protein
MSMRSNTVFGLILPISSTRSLRLNPMMNASIALSSETLTTEFLIRLYLWMYAHSVSSRCCTHALTSSIDAGRLYVDLKLLVNCFVRSSQLPIVSFSSLLNHDLAASVRCSCKLSLLFLWFLLIFVLLVDNLRATIMVPVIRHTFADHEVT